MCKTYAAPKWEEMHNCERGCFVVLMLVVTSPFIAGVCLGGTGAVMSAYAWWDVRSMPEAAESLCYGVSRACPVHTKEGRRYYWEQWDLHYIVGWIDLFGDFTPYTPPKFECTCPTCRCIQRLRGNCIGGKDVYANGTEVVHRIETRRYG